MQEGSAGSVHACGSENTCWKHPPPTFHSAKGLLHTFPPSSHAQPVTSLHSSLRNQKQPGQAADPRAHSPRGSVRCIHVPRGHRWSSPIPPADLLPPPEPHPTSLLSWINPSAQKHPLLPGPQEERAPLSSLASFTATVLESCPGHCSPAPALSPPGGHPVSPGTPWRCSHRGPPSPPGT